LLLNRVKTFFAYCVTCCNSPYVANLKLRERVFHSLTSCSFTFIGERSSLSELHSFTFLDSFWRLLWSSALGSCLVCLNVAPALISRCYSK